MNDGGQYEMHLMIVVGVDAFSDIWHFLRRDEWFPSLNCE